MEPSVFAFAERHDNIEAIIKADRAARHGRRTELLKEMHRIVKRCDPHPFAWRRSSRGLTFDLSQIDSKKAAR